MNATLPQIMSDTLTYLMTLSDEGVRPQEAKTRLRLLQQRYPDAGMHLVWEEEGYDASIHYDVLVHLAEGATVSLSFCPDRAIPWPLRGAHHWSERELHVVVELREAFGLEARLEAARDRHRRLDARRAEIGRGLDVELIERRLRRALRRFRSR